MIADTLIDDETWASSPEDARQAFAYIVLAARARLDQVLSDEKFRGPHSLDAWRRQYIYEISAIADEFEISGLNSPDVAVQTAAHMAEFDASLARIITSIKAANRASLRDDSAALGYQTKDTIRRCLDDIRAKVNSSNLSEKQKAALHKKIDAVETELDKTRASMTPFWVLSGALTLASAGVGTMSDIPGALKTFKDAISLVHADKKIETDHNSRLSEPALLEHKPVKQITDQTNPPKV